MYVYKAIIAYDGTDYYGWQRQPEKLTVEATIAKIFQAVFKVGVTVLGASRTDAGVHALGQVMRLQTTLKLPAHILQRALNQHLPVDILVRSLEENDGFHPHKNVEQKTYWYHVFKQRPLPFVSRYGFYYPKRIDIEKLYALVQFFVGTHDFRSFCTGNQHENTVRTIDNIAIRWYKKFGVWQIEVKGKRFLHFMVRRIIGASLQVASDPSMSYSLVKHALDNPQSAQPFLKAPAKGLMLARITYKS